MFSALHESQDKAALDFIAQRARDGLPPPTLQEVADRLGMRHLMSASRVLDRLVRDGKVERPAGHRTVRLVESRQHRRRPTAPRLSVPHRSPVSCGPGVEAEDGDDELDLAAMFKRDDLAAYTAVGTSMIEAGIHPGDILVVRECPVPESGQKVVAMLDRKMLCKKYHPTDRGTVMLKPCNATVEPIEVDPDRGHFRVLGVLHTLIRKF